MKRLLMILVLGLLWCNVGFAQELIKIPVHVHIVQIEEGDYKTITTPEDVREDFKNAKLPKTAPMPFIKAILLKKLVVT